MEIVELKKAITAYIDTLKDDLVRLSQQIHDNPEQGMEEVMAAAWLTGYLEGNGFKVETGICSLPTAFQAVYGSGKPIIALLAEYDALPEIGHACGHNIIAAGAAGAGVAAKQAVDRFGGRLEVIGTPAEELQGGKVIMAGCGAFGDVDFAMMIHPGNADAVIARSLEVVNLTVEFFGRAAHAAAAPENGRNALDAMIIAFNSINSLRQQLKSSVRIHGIITDGGKAANIIPDHSAGLFMVRGETTADVDDLCERVLGCFKGAAMATGTRLEYRWGENRYAAMMNNNTLAGVFKDNLAVLGRHVREKPYLVGSTDMGNVSHIVPSIHPFIAIGTAYSAHTPEFAAAAAADTGIAALLDGAKSLAMTVADLLARPELRQKAREEFERDHD